MSCNLILTTCFVGLPRKEIWSITRLCPKRSSFLTSPNMPKTAEEEVSWRTIAYAHWPRAQRSTLRTPLDFWCCSCPHHFQDELPRQPNTWQERERFLTPIEAMAAQTLPVTDLQAHRARAPKLELDGVKPSEIRKMAGNSMSVPCMGCVLLAAICALEPVPWAICFQCFLDTALNLAMSHCTAAWSHALWHLIIMNYSKEKNFIMD